MTDKQKKPRPRTAPLAPPLAPPLATEDDGFGESHGYGPGHGGPSGPGDVPADETPAGPARQIPTPADDGEDLERE